MERLQALPEPQRAAIVMRELEGLSHEEIAAALGPQRRRRAPGDLPGADGPARRPRAAGAAAAAERCCCEHAARGGGAAPPASLAAAAARPAAPATARSKRVPSTALIAGSVGDRGRGRARPGPGRPGRRRDPSRHSDPWSPSRGSRTGGDEPRRLRDGWRDRSAAMAAIERPDGDGGDDSSGRHRSADSSGPGSGHGGSGGGPRAVAPGTSDGTSGPGGGDDRLRVRRRPRRRSETSARVGGSSGSGKLRRRSR